MREKKREGDGTEERKENIRKMTFVVRSWKKFKCEVVLGISRAKIREIVKITPRTWTRRSSEEYE